MPRQELLDHIVVANARPSATTAAQARVGVPSPVSHSFVTHSEASGTTTHRSLLPSTVAVTANGGLPPSPTVEAIARNRDLALIKRAARSRPVRLVSSDHLVSLSIAIATIEIPRHAELGITRGFACSLPALLGAGCNRPYCAGESRTLIAITPGVRQTSKSTFAALSAG